MIESAEQFEMLRTSEDLSLYHRAAHESASDETWQEVITKFPAMRVWVAHNKTVPVSILAILARDADVRVRRRVAMKRKAGFEILQWLSQDPDESVRLQVALNSGTSRSILEELLNDQWARVVEVATDRLQSNI